MITDSRFAIDTRLKAAPLRLLEWEPAGTIAVYAIAPVPRLVDRINADSFDAPTRLAPYQLIDG